VFRSNFGDLMPGRSSGVPIIRTHDPWHSHRSAHAIHSAWLPSRDVCAKSIPDQPLEAAPEQPLFCASPTIVLRQAAAPIPATAPSPSGLLPQYPSQSPLVDAAKLLKSSLCWVQLDGCNCLLVPAASRMDDQFAKKAPVLRGATWHVKAFSG
jgi:hypothetical protein